MEVAESYVGQINHLLGMLLVTLILSDWFTIEMDNTYEWCTHNRKFTFGVVRGIAIFEFYWRISLRPNYLILLNQENIDLCGTERFFFRFVSMYVAINVELSFVSCFESGYHVMF